MKNLTKKNRAAVALGSIKSEKKAQAARENGKKGGRPRQCCATVYPSHSGIAGELCSKNAHYVFEGQNYCHVHALNGMKLGKK